jgi:deazaflavin-dependent oxidoreductase (nitroreductase family)
MFISNQIIPPNLTLRSTGNGWYNLCRRKAHVYIQDVKYDMLVFMNMAETIASSPNEEQSALTISINNLAEQIPYPDGIFRHLLRLPIWLYRLGLGSLMNFMHIMVLTTRGRTTGLPRHTAIEYRAHGRKIYVVSAWGVRPQWYQNLLINPIVGLRQGQRSLKARARKVDDPDEALRALYLFRKTAPAIYDSLMARLSGENAINGKTLPNVSHEFTVVRLDPEETAENLPTVTDDLKTFWLFALLTGTITLALMLFAGTRRSKNHHG